MNKLLLVLIALLVIGYARYFVTYNSHIEFIQSDLSKLNSTHLLEKNPIIIQDRIVNIDSLFGSLFKFLYVHKKELEPSIAAAQNPYRNKSRFAVIYMKEDGSIHLSHPTWVKKDTANNNNNYKYIEIPLKKNQVAVIPTFWYFKLQTPETTDVYLLNGIASLLFSPFML